MIDKNSHWLDRDPFPRSNPCRACSDPPDCGYYHYTHSDTPLGPVGCIRIAYRPPRPVCPACEAPHSTPRIDAPDRSTPATAAYRDDGRLGRHRALTAGRPRSASSVNETAHPRSHGDQLDHHPTRHYRKARLVRVAQLDRASASGAEGRGFESLRGCLEVKASGFVTSTSARLGHP